MVTNLQFAAVAAYLLWCLFTALTRSCVGFGQCAVRYVAAEIDTDSAVLVVDASHCDLEPD